MISTIIHKLNAHYFGGKIRVGNILIVEMPPMVFARCNIATADIYINKALMDDIKALEYICYHELCHIHLFETEHNERFTAELKKYHNFICEFSHFVEFVKSYWLRIGYITKEELEV